MKNAVKARYDALITKLVTEPNNVTSAEFGEVMRLCQKIEEKDLACDQEPVKVAAIFDGHRWQLFSTRPVEIAIVTCLSGQEKPRPVTVANIQPVVDMATFRETVHDKLAALTQSGQIDLRQLVEFTK